MAEPSGNQVFNALLVVALLALALKVGMSVKEQPELQNRINQMGLGSK